jgi:thioredoxin 1
MVSLIKTIVILFISTACSGQVFASFQTSQPQIRVEIHRAESNPGKGLIEVAAPDRDEKVYMYTEAIITNKDIIEASAADGLGIGVRPYQVLNMTFTKEAAERMAKVSELHHGKPLVILIDGKVISAPTIYGKVYDKVQITTDISKEEAERIAKALNSKAQDASAIHPSKSSDSPSVRNNNEKDEVIPDGEAKHDVEVIKRNQIELPKVTNEDFQNSVLKSRELVLVYFLTKQCPPCQMFTTTIEEIADKYKGKMKVFQLDLDKGNEIVRQYGIKGVPTIILFRAGSEIDRIVGAASQENISRMIDHTKQ